MAWTNHVPIYARKTTVWCLPSNWWCIYEFQFSKVFQPKTLTKKNQTVTLNKTNVQSFSNTFLWNKKKFRQIKVSFFARKHFTLTVQLLSCCLLKRNTNIDYRNKSLLYLDWYKKMRLRTKTRPFIIPFYCQNVRYINLEGCYLWFGLVGKNEEAQISRLGILDAVLSTIVSRWFCWDHCIWLHFPRDVIHLWGNSTSNISCNLW